jgi:undecaprenyl-diphosphatase
MQLLYLFESIRNPFLDSFFALITHLGSETLFLAIAIVVFWCVSKKEGYYLMTVGFIGTLLNQFLKLLCRIPRPWVLDETFAIVESARAEATGYSFPSGHTQMAAGLYGGIARWHRGWVRVIGIILALLIGFSRLYLGVHTPLDVGVGLLMAAALVLVLYPLMHKVTENERVMRILLGSMVLIAAGNLAYVSLYPFPADVDAENLAHGLKQAYTTLGSLTGLLIAFEIERRYICFETKAVWWVQIIKAVLGLVLLLAIKEGLKIPLRAILGTHHLGDGIRYCCLTMFAGCVWPLSFQRLNKLSAKGKA